MMMPDFFTKWFQFITAKPWIVLLLVSLITVSLGLESRNLHVEMDISKALPEDIPAKRLYDRVGEIFPSRDLILVVVESDELFDPMVIARLDSLTRILEVLPGVSSVMSPTNAKVVLGTEKGMEVREALAGIPKTAEEMAAYKNRLLSDNIYVGNIISRDMKAAGIMLFLKKRWPSQRSGQIGGGNHPALSTEMELETIGNRQAHHQLLPGN